MSAKVGITMGKYMKFLWLNVITVKLTFVSNFYEITLLLRKYFILNTFQWKGIYSFSVLPFDFTSGQFEFCGYHASLLATNWLINWDITRLLVFHWLICVVFYFQYCWSHKMPTLLSSTIAQREMVLDIHRMLFHNHLIIDYTQTTYKTSDWFIGHFVLMKWTCMRISSRVL